MRGVGRMVKNMEQVFINGLMIMTSKRFTVTKESFNMIILMAWQSSVTLKVAFFCSILKTVF